MNADSSQIEYLLLFVFPPKKRKKTLKKPAAALHTTVRMCVLLDHRSLTCSSTAAGRLSTAHPLKARSHQFEERIGAKSTVVFTISATAEYFLFVNVFFRVDRLSNVHCTYTVLCMRITLIHK